MWKRRAEIAVLALLVIAAGWDRPRVSVPTPSVDLAGLMPDRVDTVADVGMVALSVAVRLLH